MKSITRRNFCWLTSGAAAGLVWGPVPGRSQTNPPAGGTPAADWIPADAPNAPIGQARGIFPGRVTWIREARVARWDGRNGCWWHDGNIDEPLLASLFSRSLQGLTGTNSDAQAWGKLFTHYNQTRRQEARGWRPGETIAIKVNLNNTLHYEEAGNNIDQSPQATRALLRQLTQAAGIPEANILVYDASVGWHVRALPDRLYDPLHAEFPKVRWMDGQGLKGREAADWVEGMITYSSPETTLGQMLPKQIVDATYLINFALFKGHEMSGVTLCAKNHFGSIKFPQRDHGKYVTPMKRPADAYSAYVDLMGCPNLGAKTVLYIVDGIYGMQTNVGAPKAERDRFHRHFNGEWSASYFMSQDPVAIDSVGLDFLRTEFAGELGFSGAKAFPKGAIRNCDNYLHEAANGENAKLGPYRPNGIQPGSLGVHEHWNNPRDRQYSRNLSPEGKGIELHVLKA